MDVPEAAAACSRVVDEVGGAVVADREFLDRVTLGILARGHVLLEDVPGTGKTLSARSFAAALGLEFSRVQFTPDLLPSDVTGTNVFDEGDGSFAFSPGPIFANVVLADEINRAPPKTQAALLEAMEEGQVTVDGETHDLPDPFYVIATQNPVESEGRSRFPRPNSTGSRSRPRSATPATRARSNCSDGARVASSRRRRSSACSIRTPSPASARCRRGSASTTIC